MNFNRCSIGEAPRLIQYAYNLFLCFSQILSTILGGDPDESISSRTGKAARSGRWWFKKVQAPFIDWLTGEENHCALSIEDDEGIKQIWDWSKTGRLDDTP